MRAGSGAEAEATAYVGRGLDRCLLDRVAATLCIVGGIYTVNKQWRSQDLPQCSGGGRGKDIISQIPKTCRGRSPKKLCNDQNSSVKYIHQQFCDTYTES